RTLRSAATYIVSLSSLVRRAILVHKLPPTLDLHRLQIVIRIATFVSWCPVAHFEVDDFMRGSVDQAVPVPGSGLESRAHSRRELNAAFVVVQGLRPLEDIDEFILPCMSVAQRRNCPGSKP